MNIHSVIAATGSATTFFIALVLPAQALGVGVASIHPIDAVDSLQTVVEPGGYIQINPNLDPVLSNEDYSHTGSIEVDQATGRIRGYAGYKLDSARSVTRTGNLIGSIQGTGEPALVSNVSGGIVYTATVNGPGNGPASATVFIGDRYHGCTPAASSLVVPVGHCRPGCCREASCLNYQRGKPGPDSFEL